MAGIMAQDDFSLFDARTTINNFSVDDSWEQWQHDDVDESFSAFTMVNNTDSGTNPPSENSFSFGLENLSVTTNNAELLEKNILESKDQERSVQSCRAMEEICSFPVSENGSFVVIRHKETLPCAIASGIMSPEIDCAPIESVEDWESRSEVSSVITLHSAFWMTDGEVGMELEDDHTHSPGYSYRDVLLRAIATDETKKIDHETRSIESDQCSYKRLTKLPSISECSPTADNPSNVCNYDDLLCDKNAMKHRMNFCRRRPHQRTGIHRFRQKLSTRLFDTVGYSSCRRHAANT